MQILQSACPSLLRERGSSTVHNKLQYRAGKYARGAARRPGEKEGEGGGGACLAGAGVGLGELLGAVVPQVDDAAARPPISTAGLQWPDGH